MTCPNCGTHLSPASEMCLSCGTPVGKAAAVEFATVSPGQAAAAPFTESPTVSPTQVPTVLPTLSGDASTAAMPHGHPPRATHTVLEIGQSFGPRYRVLKLLGMGGMGAVYQAWDEELTMAVALKVIRPDRTAGGTNAESERRFKQELVLARQVTHKNVIRIHDLGEVDGTKYISMPYVEGSDLARIIQRSGKLPLPQALDYARQIAAGLRAAHEVGVVHRDLKPANILIGDEHALITDFGIAHSIAGPRDGAGADAVIGTIRYMAPEQAQGLPVDHRADIYSFGLILYEMLAGKRWADNLNTYDVLVAKREAGDTTADAPEQPFDAGELPETVARIVARCVERDPEQRYRSVAELLEDLEYIDDEGNARPRPAVFTIPSSWPLIGGRTITRDAASALLVLALAVPVASAAAFFGGSWFGAPSAPVQQEPVSVLVADFENRTGDSVFDGVMEPALGVAIEAASFINAYPRVDAQRLVLQIAPNERLDVERARLVAQREGIKVVLAGSIAAEGSRYRITVNAVDPIPGATLSTASAVASTKDDVLGAIGELGSDLRTALGDTTPESARISERETFTTASFEAANAYSQGQNLLAASKYAEAVPYFQRATELDPSFGRAYSSWALASYYLGRRDETETLYKRAFSLIDRMTEREKFRVYGTYYVTVAQAYPEAVKNYERLVELYPADLAGHANLAVASFYTLDFPKALEHGRRAVALYPASLKQRSNYALYSMYAGDFAGAVREAEQVIKADPAYYQAYFPLAIAATDQSIDAARAVYERMAAASPAGASRAAMGLSDLALYEGRHAEAVTGLLPAIAADEKNRNRAALASKSIALAEAYQAQGLTRQARNAVGRALDARRHESVLLPAARILLSQGQDAEARQIAVELGNALGGYGRAYARLLEGELALERGAIADAVDALRAGQQLGDLWLLHFVLGTAYVQAERYPEALAEFEACLKRRGEATAVFLDDVPSFRYLASLPYWLARAQEGVGLTKQAAENYQRFVSLRVGSPDEARVRDARERVAKLKS